VFRDAHYSVVHEMLHFVKDDLLIVNELNAKVRVEGEIPFCDSGR
jgi:hypothetical protein